MPIYSTVTLGAWDLASALLQPSSSSAHRPLGREPHWMGPPSSPSAVAAAGCPPPPSLGLVLPTPSLSLDVAPSLPVLSAWSEPS